MPDAPTIVIAAAMDIEAAPFLERLDCRDQLTAGSRMFHVGTIDGVEVAVVVSGIGIANAAATAAQAGMVFDQRIGAYICAGTTGGLGRDVNVRDLIVGTRFTYSGADATAFNYAPGQVPGMPVDYRAGTDLADILTRDGAKALTTVSPKSRIHAGLVLSSDAFILADSAEQMRRRFSDALGADMESTAAAQVCSLVGIPMVSARGVSDLCGPSADQDFHIDAEDAAHISATVVIAALPSLVAAISR